jgi:glycosyltransferase involved in cell wall biosynthesis
MNDSEIWLSFCTCSRNRLWQLKKTLDHNLSVLSGGVEIVLVDYGSKDGLAEWVWENFRESVSNKKLNFFEVKNEVSWNVSKAKNLAHRLARGQYLFNLDADNFLNTKDIPLIQKAYHSNHPTHQWSGVFGDGSFGRIGLPKDLYVKLGGYDESLLPMGGQDVDLFNRIIALGLRFAKLPEVATAAVSNSVHDKVAALSVAPDKAASLYDRINKFNVEKSKLRLRLEGPIRRDGFATFRGLLNEKPVVIDGFNHIRAYKFTEFD